MPDRLVLAAGDLSLVLDPQVGGSIVAFTHRDRPLFRTGPEGGQDANANGCFPLVPFCNRIRDGRFVFRGRDVRLSPNLPPQKHPLHGQGWRSAWTVDRSGPRQAELVFDYAPGEWPWPYEARQTFALDPDGLTLVLTCRNTGADPMPCGLGFHPYYVADDQTRIQTDVQSVWTVDDEVMPVALEPAVGRYALTDRRIEKAGLDNGYEGWSGHAAITWPDRRLRLTLSSAAPRFQLYSPFEGGLIVAEPVSHANAVLNRPESEWARWGMIVLAPQETLSLAARFAVAELVA